jgi:hypothetical protein
MKPLFRLLGLLIALSEGLLHAQPANDNFANRVVLAGTNISLTASNIGATKELGEPNHGGKTGGASVWWSWNAPITGRVVVAVNGDFDTLLGVYSGTDVTSLTNLAGAEGYSPLRAETLRCTMAKWNRNNFNLAGFDREFVLHLRRCQFG